MKCLKFDAAPEGEWFCPLCTKDQEQEEREEEELALAVRDQGAIRAH